MGDVATTSGRPGRGLLGWIWGRRGPESAESAEAAYLQTLAEAAAEDFADLNQLNFLSSALDRDGRPLVWINAKNFPAAGKFPARVSLQRLLRYLVNTLDGVCDEPYTLVWLHTGASYTKNCPSLAWLWRTYERLPPKYRTHMAHMYIVHCDLTLWLGISALLPWWSSSLWKKIVWIDRVEFLEPELLTKKQLKTLLPAYVVEHDAILEDQPLMDYGVVAPKDMVPGIPVPI